jgi:hypothetical protein
LKWLFDMGQGPTAMTPLVKAILGAGALSLALGAAELASGHDLSAPLHALSGNDAGGVNRAAKADRVVLRTSTQPTQTFGFTVSGVAATSVLVRIPQRREARETPRPPLPLKSGQDKRLVACEPVVSVLTEVAKKLQPGRCLA